MIPYIDNTSILGVPILQHGSGTLGKPLLHRAQEADPAPLSHLQTHSACSVQGTWQRPRSHDAVLILLTGCWLSELHEGRQRHSTSAAPGGPPLQAGPSCRCGPLLSGGPSGSSLPSGCFWAYMAHQTISLSSLPWVREVSGSSVYKAQYDTFSLRALFTPSAGLYLSLGTEDGLSSRPPLLFQSFRTWTTSPMLPEGSLECLPSALLGVGSGKGQTKPLFLSPVTRNLPSSP